MYSALKGLLLFDFSIGKADKCQRKSDFHSKKCLFWRFCGVIFTISWVKKVVFGSFSKFFSSCLRNVCFFMQKSKFWFYFQLKRLIHDPEFGDLRSNMWSFWRFWRAVLTILGGDKVVFCTFQSCSGVFRKCFGIILALNRPTSGSISQQRLFPKIYSPLLGSRWSSTKIWLRFRKIRISRIP